MTKEMWLIFEKGKWNDKRGYSGGYAASVPIAFSYVFCIVCQKAALLRRKMHSVEPQRFSRHVAQQNKSHSLRNDFFVLVEISGIEPLTS